MKTHIYDFTPEELEAIRRADEEIEERIRARQAQKARRDTSRCGGDMKSAERKKYERLNRIGNPIWEYRVKYNLTQRELAKQMYITQETISAWERGKCKVSRYALEWLRERGETV